MRKKKKLMILGSCVLGIAVLGGIGIFRECSSFSRSASVDKESLTFTVKRGDLKISVKEDGILEAKTYTKLSFESRGTIKKILPEGTEVKKGEVIIQLDSTDSENRERQAEAELVGANSALTWAQEDLILQKIANKVALETVQDKVEETKQQYKEFVEIDAPEILNKAKVDVKKAKIVLENAQRDEKEAEALLKEDLVSPNEVRQKKIAFEDAQNQYETARLNEKKASKYDYPLQLTQKKNARAEAEDNLGKTKSGNATEMAKRKSAVEKAKAELEEKKVNLDKIKKDLDNMTMKAPISGVIFYGNAEQPTSGSWVTQQLHIGGQVYGGDTLISIPDTTGFKVGTAVIEQEISRVKKGCRVLVTADAYPDLTLKGVVTKVAEVATKEGWWGSDIPKYKIEVAVDETHEGLRPGMQVKVEIVSGEYENILDVPVDAIFQKEGKNIVYVQQGSKATPREVTLGASSDDYMIIKKGLKEGETVLLSEPTP